MKEKSDIDTYLDQFQLPKIKKREHNVYDKRISEIEDAFTILQFPQ